MIGKKGAMIHRRKLFYIKYLASLGILLLILCFVYTSWETVCSIRGNLRNPRIIKEIIHAPRYESPKVITLVTVMCHGPQQHGAPNETTPSPTSRKGISRQMRQTQVMLKSLLVMEHEYLRQNKREPDSEQPTLELILYTDYKQYYDELVDFLYNSNEINSEYLKPLRLIYAPVVYPKGYEHLKYFFRPCTTLRLFMDKILPSHDSVVYLDTDLIFLKPVRELFNEFYTFNQTQWCAMGMDWYHHHTHTNQIPYYGSQGLNAGVGIYNLTRMRSTGFAKSLDQIFEEYLNKTKFADQDILNIYFHFHPHELKLLPCYRNYIPNYCRAENRCRVSDGVTILHGITMTFMPETYETQFQETFEFFKSLKLTKVLQLESIQEELRERLCKSARRSKPMFSYREEHCIANLDFADEILGQL